jgi:hypothetical protein
MLQYDAEFPPDATEREIPDLATALGLVRAHREELLGVMQEIGDSFLAHFGPSHAGRLKKTQDALLLSLARLGVRHGSWGSDLHHYHNEGHALELLLGRLARIRLDVGWDVLPAEDWLLLALFCTCHDLRQRERPEPDAEIGANERASIAECHRILRAVGFDPEADADFFDFLAAMIAGSTFDARPLPLRSAFNTADAASSGGSLAPKLVRQIRAQTWHPSLRPPRLERCCQLMLIAADIDTANVGEPYPAFAGSAVRLALEREMRFGRSLRAAESAQPVFEFLTVGQERYFFELHRFVSDLGRQVFEPGKLENGPRERRQSEDMRERFGPQPSPAVTGQELVDAFMAHAATLSGL